MKNCAIFAVNILLCICCYAEEPYMIELKDKYGFLQWGKQITNQYEQSVQEWRPTIESYGLVPEKSLIGGSALGRMKVQTNIVVRIEYHEEKTMRDAWNYMMMFFGNCSAPQPFPDGKEKGVDIGDRSYVGYGRNITSIFFVRNNMFFHIKASGLVSDEASVLDIAKSIDREIIKLSIKKRNPQNNLETKPNTEGDRAK